MVIIMDMESGSHLHADFGASCEEMQMPRQQPQSQSQSQTAWLAAPHQALPQRHPQLQLGLQEVLPLPSGHSRY